MNLSEPFIRRPVMTVVLTVSAVLFGILAYLNLPVNDLPAVDYPVIQVNVGYPGASPQTVAATIATPLEKQFMQIPGLELITSTSRQGFCTLNLQFDLNKSIDAAATDVQAAISRATGNLPPDLPSPPTFVKTNPNDQPILYFALASDTMTKGQLYDLANTQIAQKITMINGVSQVNVYGTKSAIRIKADPSRLAARGLTIEDLAAAIQRGTSYQGAGQLDGPNRTFLLQPQGQLDTAQAYNDLIIATRDNAPVYLRDVAGAEDSVQDERVNMHFWVRDIQVPPATVVLAVSRQAGANAVQVASRVKALAPEIQPTLPGGTRMLLIYDRSQTIVHSVRDVQETLLIAFLLVVAIIFIFLGRASDTLIPTVALPLSLLLTFIVMNWLGFSIDNLSLMALTLAIGFLVDDAIVFLENTVRRMEQYSENPLMAAINSAQEISFTILSMTLSLAVVFLPLVFMPGQVGRIFREFAVTIVVAILASGIVSLTLTPLMCARVLGQRGPGAKQSFIERFVGAIEKQVLRLYGHSLWFFLRHRWISVVVWIACLGGTIWLLRIIPKSFLPTGDSSFAWGVLIAQEGASPQQMRDYQARAEQVLHANPSVRATMTVTGVGQFFGSNQGIMITFLKPPEERPPLETFGPDGKPVRIEHPTIQQVSADLQQKLMMNLPGAIGVLTPQPVLEISTGATSRSTGAFAYSISGINPQEVYQAAGALLQRLMPRVGTMFAGPPQSDMYLNTPNLKINILRDKAESLGVSAARIESLLRHAYSQNYVYLIKRADDQYQVILEVHDQARRTPEDLGLLYIRTDDGRNIVPLNAVATWQPTTGPQAVNHINQFTSVTINFNLVPGVSIGQAVDFVSNVAAEVLPPTLRGSFQGQALTFQQTIGSLVPLILLAVFVMYVILAILYESYLHPITVLSTLPTAMVGGLATLWLFGEEASLYAFIGLFMLMGIVKKNGILIVDFAIQRIAEGQTAEQAIHDASMDRFRPILMTTLAAVMGAVPIAMAWGSSGAERRSLGLVIVGGLLVSQLITLYVTPVIYLYMELFQEKVLNRIPFFAAHYEGHAYAPGKHVHVHYDEQEHTDAAQPAPDRFAPVPSRRNGNGQDDDRR
ncbi:efflux RND transporter permease subunit [Fontivita pretiosa]|uniref:efflux RND transporter permease subunit n=1 Tax=Fontivita pretiosa TaxID=2989684 RepID=UPI003D1856B7